MVNKIERTPVVAFKYDTGRWIFGEEIQKISTRDFITYEGETLRKHSQGVIYWLIFEQDKKRAVCGRHKKTVRKWKYEQSAVVVRFASYSECILCVMGYIRKGNFLPVKASVQSFAVSYPKNRYCGDNKHCERLSKARVSGCKGRARTV